MNFNDKRIGIWGFGVVGKAALNALAGHCAHLSVIDRRPLTESERTVVASHQATLYAPDHLEHFLNDHDFILPSPGIDLRPYAHHASKFISELDLFFAQCTAPIIAITGTVGKTTTTSLLAHTLEVAGYKVCVGGNIGIGMLDLLKSDETYDYVVLEISSFQLELTKFFSPHLALWTNFYPNHLDRHGTVEEYFAAKQRMFIHQRATDYAIAPLEISNALSKSVVSQKTFFTTTVVEEKTVTTLSPENALVFVNKDALWIQRNGKTQKLIELATLPDVTYQQNLIAIIAALIALQVPVEKLIEAAATFEAHEHRLEKVTTVNGVDFYNDSKSTIIESTLAALEKLQGKPVLLLLGGLSKGVDRSHLFTAIKGKASEIFCFGKEAEVLYQAGTASGISCHRFGTLEEALQAAVACARPGDQILFSPSGSSYDLFTDYRERGKKFKELVRGYQQH